MNVRLAADHGLSLNKNWLILDSSYTVTTTINPNLVHNQCTEQVGTRLYTNGGRINYARGFTEI